MTAPDGRDAWVGTYTGASEGGKGIYRLRMPAGGSGAHAELAAVADSPSYLARHPGGNALYAVSETTDGQVLAFSVSARGSLRRTAVADVPAGPCHVVVHPDTGHLLVASYGAGAVSALPLDQDGFGAGRSTTYGHGSGPVAKRQEGPHAHAVSVAPDGTVLSTDLGADVVRAHRIGAGGGLDQVGEVRLPAGSGPRHLVVHPGGYVYVLTELAQSVVVLEARSGYADLRVVAEGAATAGGADTNSQSAAITMSADWRFVYTSMRGADVVTVHQVRAAGGSVRALLDVDCGGRWPRDICVDGDRLLVANQHSHTVAGMRLVGGVPEDAAQVVAEVPAPACIIPALPR